MKYGGKMMRISNLIKRVILTLSLRGCGIRRLIQPAKWQSHPARADRYTRSARLLKPLGRREYKNVMCNPCMSSLKVSTLL